MVISKEKYCIISKEFPLRFYRCGNAVDELIDDVLMNKESCEYELSTYDEPDKFHILKVQVTYEF